MKKILSILLLCVVFVFCAIGFAACSNTNGDMSLSDERDADIVSVYNMYVAYAEENGTTPLSYELWLATLKGDKGDKGVDGKDGIDGTNGVDGADGVGVKSAVIDENGDLIITLTNDAKINAGKIVDNDNPQGLDFYLLPDGTFAVSGGTAIYLEEITIPSTYKGKAVTQIMSGGLFDDGGGVAPWGYTVKNIIIPDSVTKIEKYAFYGCSSLKTVYYKGTAEEWGKIDFGGWSNKSLTNATHYYYSETKPTEDGNYWHYDTDGVTPVVWAKEN